MVKSIKTMSASDSELGARDSVKQKNKNNPAHYSYGVQDTNIEAISERVSKAVLFNKTDKPLVPSRNLIISKSFTQASVVCPISGIVSLLDIPVIPGKTLVYENPLADIANARGIVQQGRLYLRQLDAQILSGLFLVLAQAYELYRDTADGTGAERNALLRSIPTDVLIEALLLIENWIHSGNSVYIPKISLVYDKADTRNTLNARMRGWLDAVIAALSKPDRETYDENAKPVRVVFASVSSEKKAKRKMLSEKVFAEKIWRQDKKAAKDFIDALAASNKFKAFLTVLFTGNGLQNADKGLVSLAAEKLEQIDSVASKALRDLIRKDRAGFAVQDIFEEDMAESEQKFADKPIGFYAMEQDKLSGEHSEPRGSGSEQALESEKDSEEQTEAVQKDSIPEPSYAGMSAIQKILARKAWLKATGQTAESTAVYNPAKQLVLQHVYIPTAATKVEEAEIAQKLALGKAEDAPS